MPLICAQPSRSSTISLMRSQTAACFKCSMFMVHHSMLNVEHGNRRSTVGNPQEVRCSAAALQCSIGDPACRLDPPCRLPAGWPPAFSSSHPCARICPSNPPCFQEPTSSPSPKPNQPTRLLCDGVSL